MFRIIKLIIILLTILNFSFLNAQEDTTKCYLKGVVTTEHNFNPEDLEINVKNSLTEESFVSYTDAYGKFSFELDEGEYELQIAYEDYAPYDEKGIVLKNSETRNIYVLLVERLYTIEEIEVEGQRKQRQDDLRTSLYDISTKKCKDPPWKC